MPREQFLDVREQGGAEAVRLMEQHFLEDRRTLGDGHAAEVRRGVERQDTIHCVIP